MFDVQIQRTRLTTRWKSRGFAFVSAAGAPVEPVMDGGGVEIACISPVGTERLGRLERGNVE